MSQVYGNQTSESNCLDEFWSCIYSFIGCHKSIKLIANYDVNSLVSCAAEYLGQIPFHSPLSDVIYSSVKSHHETYGCSCASMLAMVYFWHRCITKYQYEHKIEVDQCFCELEQCLEDVIKLLNPITIVLSSKEKAQLQCHVSKPTSKCSPNNYIEQSKVNPFNSSVGSSDCSLRSSRHFIRSHYSCTNESDYSSPSKRCPDSSVESLEVITEIVRKLSHGNAFASDLIVEVLKMQQTKSTSQCTTLRFDLTRLTTVCSVSSASNSKVLRGLLVRASSDAVELLSCFRNRTMRAVLIRGNVTPNFVHKGVNLKIRIDATIKTKVDSNSRTSLWISEVLNALKQLDISVLIVSGKVDDDLVLQLHSAKIAVLQGTGANILEIISNATGVSLASYIADCDMLNVVSGISAIVNDDTMRLLPCKNYYVNLQFPEAFQTVVICHPVDDYVTCLEHTFWHVAHRVSNAIDCDKVLPGNGIVEEFIANLSYPLASSDTVQNVAWYIITTGFKDFSEVIRQKSLACSSAIQMPFEKDVLIGDASILDDYLSKTESWRSALRLACAISKTDLIIISGDSNKINVQITQQQLCLGCL